MRKNDPKIYLREECEMPENSCLSCGHVMDRASGVNTDAQPMPGALTICIRCGHMMAFAEDLTFRELTRKEKDTAMGIPAVLAVLKTRNFVVKKKRK